MKIYVDADFRCHTTPSTDSQAFEKNVFKVFEGKCARYIEGFRYIPAGETWTREDGQIFTGEMIAPAEDSKLLEAAQAAYEEAMAANADALAALDVLGVQP